MVSGAILERLPLQTCHTHSHASLILSYVLGFTICKTICSFLGAWHSMVCGANLDQLPLQTCHTNSHASLLLSYDLRFTQIARQFAPSSLLNMTWCVGKSLNAWHGEQGNPRSASSTNVSHQLSRIPSSLLRPRIHTDCKTNCSFLTA